jgi:hypothetical protein
VEPHAVTDPKTSRESASTRRATVMVWLKRAVLIVVLLLVGRGIYEFLLSPVLGDSDPVLSFLVVWLVLSYLVLPHVQRFLARIYVPDYFIGRTRTSDGVLGDPVNLAVDGTEADLLAAMAQGGWTRADDLTFGTGWRIVRETLLRRNYAAAPVSPLFVFSRRQDLAFEQEIEGNPSRRHHVRFWKCPEGWYLPGGLQVGWIGAATYDRRVGLSAYTLQVTHKIGENTDLERDHVVQTLEETGRVASVQWRQNYFSGYRARNGGGDAITTDGNLPVLDLRGSAQTGAQTGAQAGTP